MNMRGRNLIGALSVVAASCGGAMGQAPCTPEWTDAGAELAATISVTPVVLAIQEYDPDGSGPLQRDLIMAGAFAFADTPEISGIARWDGFAWKGVGTTFGAGTHGANYVHAMCVGPDIARSDGRQALYICGAFTSVNGVPAKLVAKWDGQAWSAIGNLTGNIALSIGFHDFDGAGPQLPRLMVGGAILGGSRVLAWDGSVWIDLDFPGKKNPRDLVSFDPDGDGLAIPVLHVSTHSDATWLLDQTGWHTFDAPRFSRAFAVDPDGDGPEAIQLFLVAQGYIHSYWPWGVWRWDGGGWQGIGMRGEYPSFLGAVDLDGPGPEPTRMIAATRDHIWRRVDAEWEVVVNVTGGPSVYAVHTFDDDGAGPREPSIFVGGALYSIAGLPVSAIARFGCGFDMPRCYGDADGGGVVDFNDISLILARWGSADQPGDIDRDGVVGMNDIVAVLASWGSPCEPQARAADCAASEAAWLARGIEDFNGDGLVNMDDEMWAIANAGLDPRSPYGRTNAGE